MSRAVVVDASALIDLLVVRPVRPELERRLADAPELHAPHLVDLEVLSVLRRLTSSGRLPEHHADAALQVFATLPLERYPHVLLRRRIWELRYAVTAYDAAYLALAEFLGLPLVTSDARLAGSHGHAVTVEHFVRDT